MSNTEIFYIYILIYIIATSEEKNSVNYLRVIQTYDISSTQIGIFSDKGRNVVVDLILIASEM